MSWQENRRRNRIWYKHYKQLCEDVKALASVDDAAGESMGSLPIAAEAFVELVFNLYESRKLHKNRRVARSALESLRQAIKDTGLDSIEMLPRRYATPLGRSRILMRVLAPGEAEEIKLQKNSERAIMFGAETKTDTGGF